MRTAAVLLPFLFLSTTVSFAQQGNEKTFASPGEAVLALYNAAKSNDSQALAAIFGSNSNNILHTGDDVADKNMLANFVRRYEQMHRVVVEPDQTVTLYIGAENWPTADPSGQEQQRRLVLRHRSRQEGNPLPARRHQRK